MKKILIEVKSIANFKKDFENINEKHNKENFHKVNFVKIKNKYLLYILKKILYLQINKLLINKIFIK